MKYVERMYGKTGNLVLVQRLQPYCSISIVYPTAFLLILLHSLKWSPLPRSLLRPPPLAFLFRPICSLYIPPSSFLCSLPRSCPRPLVPTLCQRYTQNSAPTSDRSKRSLHYSVHSSDKSIHNRHINLSSPSSSIYSWL